MLKTQQGGTARTLALVNQNLIDGGEGFLVVKRRNYVIISNKTNGRASKKDA